jgi:translin
MEELQIIVSAISSRLDESNTIREKVLSLSRLSIQKSSIAIKNLHRGDLEKADQYIKENKRLISEINDLSTQMKPLRFGTILPCNQEYAEAIFLQRFLSNKPFPDFQELNIPFIAYLHGMTDFVGELRRVILDILRQGRNIEGAVRALDLMDEIYSLLITIDFPDSLTYNLRKKTDFVRNLTEKTRGDVTLATNRLQLVETIKSIIDPNENDSI